MTFAADVITYIGVPLTVAGVIPMLYNMGKCLWIWYMLSSSIPWQYRRHFKLIPDLAAGNVSVIVERMRISPAGLWNTNCTEAKSARKQGFKQRQHYYLYSAIRGIYEVPRKAFQWVRAQLFSAQTIQEDLSTELGMRQALARIACPPHLTPLALNESGNDNPDTVCNIHLITPQLLWTRWMDVVLPCGFECLPIKANWYAEKPSCQFTVDVNLCTQMPPLEMTWPQFVWLCLGLGMDPWWLSKCGEGCSISVSPSLTVKTTRSERSVLSAALEGTICDFSLRGALANMHIMLLEDEGVMYMANLTHRAELPWTLRLGTVTDAQGVYFSSSENKALAGDTPSFRDMGHAEAFKAALMWAFYIWQCRYKMPSGVAKVSHEMLNIRTGCLFFLHRAKEAGVLKSTLDAILQNQPQVVRLMSVINRLFSESWDAKITTKLHSIFSYLKEELVKLYAQGLIENPNEDWHIREIRSFIEQAASEPVHCRPNTVGIADPRIVEALDAFMFSFLKHSLGKTIAAEFQPRVNSIHDHDDFTGNMMLSDTSKALECRRSLFAGHRRKKSGLHDLQDINNPSAILANVFIALQFSQSSHKLDYAEAEWEVRRSFEKIQLELEHQATRLFMDPQTDGHLSSDEDKTCLDRCLARDYIPPREEAMRIFCHRASKVWFLVADGLSCLEEGLFVAPESTIPKVLSADEYEELVVYLS